MLKKTGCLIANCVILWKPGRASNVLVSNFLNERRTLKKGQNITSTAHQLAAMTESAFTAGSVLGLVKDDANPTTKLAAERCEESATTPMYQRCTNEATNTKEASADVTVVTHEKVNLDHVVDAHHSKIRAMLAKNRSMWDCSLGNITTTMYIIDLNRTLSRTRAHHIGRGPRKVNWIRRKYSSNLLLASSGSHPVHWAPHFSFPL